jgi:hypothetical protein
MGALPDGFIHSFIPFLHVRESRPHTSILFVLHAEVSDLPKRSLFASLIAMVLLLVGFEAEDSALGRGTIFSKPCWM